MIKTLAIAVSLVVMGACGSSDDGDETGTVNGSAGGGAPASLAGDTLRLSPDSAASAAFTTTSCTLPNYSLPSGYSWATKPKCTYSKTSGSNATFSVLYLIKTANVATLYTRVEKYTYDVNLMFSRSTGGTYSGTLTSEAVAGTGPHPTKTQNTTNLSGTFTLE